MPNHYVTFGQDHVHKVNGKVLHSNVVAVFQVENAVEGRKKAFELFGSKFSFEYPQDSWKEEDINYYPGGYVYLD